MRVVSSRYRHDIEAAFRDNIGVALEVMLCARYQASLFSRVDTIGARPEVRTTAQPYLDEGDGFCVAHDQIDFTVPASVVAGYQHEAAVDEMSAGQVLGPGSEPQGARPGRWH